MKQFILAMSFIFVSHAAHALDAGIVVEKFSQNLSRDKALVEKEVLNGKNAKAESKNIINAYINDKYTIKVDLQTAGLGASKKVDARFVVYLNNEHGGIILDVNQILFPYGHLAYKTTTTYMRGEPSRVTKMYVPVDIYSTGSMSERLAALVDAINSGKLGQLHAGK